MSVRSHRLHSELLSGLMPVEADTSADDRFSLRPQRPIVWRNVVIHRSLASSFRESAILTWIKGAEGQGVNVQRPSMHRSVSVDLPVRLRLLVHRPVMHRRKTA